ncbi:TPA: cobalt ECF transporter T component CbiQ [Candidatus Sumerlaeota bacterium]|jgi:cobalt/nickel transport system permease protein|nr:cobalt ECF transporter T component CbiQ [Candidatus Sumerlaeota bacterium]
MSPIESALLDLNRLEDLARQDTALHRIDPCAKVLTTLVFLVAVASFNKYAVAALLPLCIYPIVLIAVGNLQPSFLFKPILLALPFVFCMAIFNPLFDRVIIMSIGPAPISGGWVSFCSILLRFALSVSAALLLLASTGFYPICLALRRLGVPRVFTLQLLFLYRYLFVLAEETTRVARAHALRAPEQRRMKPSVFASVVGSLLLRTLGRARCIHTAMLSRGFTGRISQSGQLDFYCRDALFLVGWSAFFVMARLFNLPQILGEGILNCLP